MKMDIKVVQKMTVNGPLQILVMGAVTSISKWTVHLRIRIFVVVKVKDT